MKIDIPCGCTAEVNTTSFKMGERGVTCPRHERTFVVRAETPRTIVYVVDREIRYTPLDQP